MENAWTKRIEELTESRDHWKREWSLLNAGLNMAEDRIKELEAELDADRRREYGYSQQTVDALTVERDKLKAENKRLREVLDGIITVAKIICNEFPVGTASLYGWVLIGEKALKEASHD